MSKEAAVEFFKACETDPEIEKALREVQSKEGNPFDSMAEVATKMGYDTNAVEIAQVFAERAASDRAKIETMQFSEEEMAQVSGGGKDIRCSSDFDWRSRCAFNDQCLTLWKYYKANDKCSATYRDNYEESCFMDDICYGLVIHYPEEKDKKDW